MKLFVSFSYLVTAAIILHLFYSKIGINLFSLFLLLFFFSLIFQLFGFNKLKPKKCLNMFKLNNYSGLLLFISILSIKI